MRKVFAGRRGLTVPGFAVASRAAPVLGLVTTRTGLPARPVQNTGSTGGGTATQVQQWMRLRVPATVSVRYLTLTWKNVAANASTVSTLDNGPSAVTVRCGMRKGTSTPVPGYASGDGTTRDLVLQPGASGHFTVDLGEEVSGTILVLRWRLTYASAPAYWPGCDLLMTTGDDLSEFGTALTDRTLATSFSFSRPTNYAILPPLAVSGALVAPVATVLYMGDSISVGDNDTTFGEYTGYLQRALASNFAWANLAARGMQLSSFIGSATQRSRRLDEALSVGATHLFCTLGSNDLPGLGEGTIYNHMLALKALLDPSAIKLIPVTLHPRTDGTNTAKYGSDPAAAWTRRRAYNQMLRDNNGVGYGLFDAAAYSQDPNNIDLWRSDLGTPTSDGIHPSTVIHTAAMNGLATELPVLLG